MPSFSPIDPAPKRRTWRRFPPEAVEVIRQKKHPVRGELSEPCSALLPVRLSSPAECEAAKEAPPSQGAGSGAIHIELPGRALISIESGADPVLVRSVVESFSK